MVLPSGGEPAVLWLQEQVRDRLQDREVKIQQQTSPKYSHHSDGGAERATQTVRGLARMFVLLVETGTRVASNQKLRHGHGRCSTQRGSFVALVAHMILAEHRAKLESTSGISHLLWSSEKQ